MLIGDLERNPLLLDAAESGLLRFITAGSVDDGKSTLIGRLLHDTRAVFEDQLSAVARASARRGAEEIDLSLLTDGLEAEREQGITVDVAYRYFATAKRKFIIGDTPGHEQYTRNMVTAASNADAAIILVDARKGVLPQTRRHTYLVHLLGIRHVFVAVNKMDLVGNEYEVFKSIRADFLAFATPLGIADLRFFPISALRGTNVVERSAEIEWYDGASLLEALETVEVEAEPEAVPFRFPVQLVSRDAARDERTYLGRVAAGRVAPGASVVVLPSGQQAVIDRVVTLDGPVDEAVAGDSVGLVLDRQLDVSRGDMIAAVEAPPAVAKTVEATLCWLSPEPLVVAAPLLLKHTTRTVRARIDRVLDRLDIHSMALEPAAAPLRANDIAHVTLKLAQPILSDAYAAARGTGAFILIDEHTNETVGAGLIG